MNFAQKILKTRKELIKKLFALYLNVKIAQKTNGFAIFCFSGKFGEVEALLLIKSIVMRSQFKLLLLIY